MRKCFVAAVASFGIAVSAFAVTAATDDLVVAQVAVPGPPGGLVHPFLLLAPNGTLKASFGLGRWVAAGANTIFGSPVVTAYDFSLQTLGVAAPNFAEVQTVDASGHAYALDAASPPTVDVYDTSGTLLRQFNLPGGPMTADLAPDGCTLFWIDYSVNAIHRYDACANTPLTDPSPGVTAYFVRALTGGGFVAGELNDLAVFDAAGSKIRTIPLDQTPISGAFTSDGQSMWLVDGLTLVRVPLSGGPRVTSAVRAGMVAVIGETRPTLAQILAPQMPLLSPWLLAALAAVLAAVALSRVS